MHQPHRLARRLAHALLALSAAALAAPAFAAPAAAVDTQYQAAIASPARTDDDRKDDAGASRPSSWRSPRCARA
jgi:hypothetical protein